MYIDPNDQFKRERDNINEAELDQLKKIIDQCRNLDMTKEELYRFFDHNNETFNNMREEYRKRGIMV